MTLEEKLDIFYNAAINDATTQSIEILNEYKEYMAKLQQEHEAETRKKSEEAIKSEAEYLVRDRNKRISDASLLLRREITKKVNEQEQIIFQKVEQKLRAFMKTPMYFELLKKQIRSALSFAKGENIEIYLNPSDFAKKEALEKMFHCQILISNEDFIGGIRAVIRSRNVLIDHSFSSKLAEEQHSFTLK